MLRARELEHLSYPLGAVDDDQQAAALGGPLVRFQQGVESSRVDEGQILEVQDDGGGLKPLDDTEGSLEQRRRGEVELATGLQTNEAVEVLGRDIERGRRPYVRHSCPPNFIAGGGSGRHGRPAAASGSSIRPGV